jgi:hypothetical protein
MMASLWTWRSPTQGAESVADFLGALSPRSFAFAPKGYTPLSDARVLPFAAGTYLLTLVLLPRTAPFAHSRLFVLLAAAHNLALSVASTVMFFGIGRAIFHAVAAGNVASTVCNPTGSKMAPGFTHWLYIFYLTKFWELLDTVLLVLRGKPLTLLHVLHHSSVMFEVYSWLETEMVVGVWGMLANSGVHVLMYSYFAATLLGVRVPWKKMITTIQILQFISSFASLVPWFYLHKNTPGGGCTGTAGLVVSAFCNGAFLILFVRFYLQTYKATKYGRDVAKDA